MPDLTGSVLGRHYRVESFVGRGGMSDVYRVWDEQRLVWLAMKVLHEDLAYDKVFLRRFEREAQTLATLQHPHIVRFYGLEQAEGLAFMLMDYVDGSTLRKEIALHSGPLPLSHIRRILQPVCAALHYAHQLGIVHCDVKPGNIMLHKNGTVLVADFGIARLTEAVTTMTMVGAGTPAYMAPEQVRGLPPTPPTDIYALGIVLYEMLTGGERPFTGDMATITGTSGEKVRWEQVNLNPLPPRYYNPAISAELQAVVLRCLEKDPSKRYPSSVALLQAIEEAAQRTAGAEGAVRRLPAASPPKPATQLPPRPAPEQPADREPAGLPTLLDAPQPEKPVPVQAPPSKAQVAAPKAVPPAQPAAPRRFPGWLLSLLLGVMLIAIVGGAMLLRNNPPPAIPAPTGPLMTSLAQVGAPGTEPTKAPPPTEAPPPTPEPLPSETPSGTPLPQIPALIQAEFSSPVSPNPQAMFSPLLFSEEIDENSQPSMPAVAFTTPLRQLYAVFSYDQVNIGAQWTALWYRGSQLVYYETRPWDGGTGGLGYSIWYPGMNQWIPGEYEVQIFLGLTWKTSGFFTIEDMPATLTPTPSPTATLVTASPTLEPPTSTPTIQVYPTATYTPVPTKKVVPPTSTPTVPPPEKKTATPPPP